MRLLSALSLVASLPLGAQAVRIGTPVHPSTLGGYRPGMSGDSAHTIPGSRVRECNYVAARYCVTRDTAMNGNRMRFIAEVDSGGTVRTVLFTHPTPVATHRQCGEIRSHLLSMARALGAPTGQGEFGEPQWAGRDGLTVSLIAVCMREGGMALLSLERLEGGPQA